VRRRVNLAVLLPLSAFANLKRKREGVEEVDDKAGETSTSTLPPLLSTILGSTDGRRKSRRRRRRRRMWGASI
jgi:hypothetical protein